MQPIKSVEEFLSSGKAVAPKTPSAAELLLAATKAEARLKAGDRGGAYLELYLITGNEQLLLQAQITTYSGAAGGMAIDGNYQAKVNNPELYKLTLDDFSHQIDAAVVKLARDLANDNKPEKFTTEAIRETNKAVWNDKGMSKHYPGNAQWIGIDTKEARDIVDSPGGRYAILSQDEAELGRRPEEYRNDPENYTIHEPKDGRFITVVNNKTKRIEVFFDKEFDSTRGTALDSSWRITDADLGQIPNEIPEKRILSESRLKMQYLQAGEMKPEKDLAPFNATNPKLPANLDRVFKFQGQLYQIDDRATLEHVGVNFSKILRNDSIWYGRDYTLALLSKGFKLGEDLGSPTLSERAQQGFDWAKEKGLIKPLTVEESNNYKAAVEKLKSSGLPSPFEQQYEAFTKLRLNLLSPAQQRFGLNEQAPDEKTPRDHQRNASTQESNQPIPSADHIPPLTSTANPNRYWDQGVKHATGTI